MSKVTVGEYELNYTERGDGPPLVLIHGLAGDQSAWLPQLDAWSDRYRVIAFDNRGAGQSTQVDEPISTLDMAHDTLALMDQLGVEEACIVGRSMGGAIAQHIALLAPERVRALVLCASFARLDPIGFRVLTNMREVLEWRDSWADHARHSLPNFVSPAFYNANPETVERLEGLIGGETRLPACYIAQNHACLEHDTLDDLSKITCPVLITAGGKDPICSLTATGWMAERLPQAETQIFEESSHFFLVEESERFMKIVSAWLEKNVS
ncbi:MAG: 3-oxoadipate enol-lactonase [Thermoleophilaceae bacterium]|nr:3-oxoadipate enol-lactonase [Thermoleophilaceae bacterium]